LLRRKMKPKQSTLQEKFNYYYQPYNITREDNSKHMIFEEKDENAELFRSSTFEDCKALSKFNWDPITKLILNTKYPNFTSTLK